jgi:hypothetical protein
MNVMEDWRVHGLRAPVKPRVHGTGHGVNIEVLRAPVAIEVRELHTRARRADTCRDYALRVPHDLRSLGLKDR